MNTNKQNDNLMKDLDVCVISLKVVIFTEVI